MAVVGDNRGGRNRPVAQSPDGSWSFEDARRRREQRQAGGAAPAPPTSDVPDEDLSALALSLADNLTIDGTPLSQLETHQDLDRRQAPEPVGGAPTADDILRALETEQHAGATTGGRGSQPDAHDSRSVHSLHRPSARRKPHHRRLHPARAWVIACTLIAAVGVLVLQLASGTDTNPGGHPGRAVPSGTPAASDGLIAAAMSRFLGAEHTAGLAVSRTRPRSSHVSRPARLHAGRTLLRVSTHSPSGSPRRSMSTSSSRGTSEAVDTTQQASATSSSPPSTSSGSGEGSPATEPHSSSGSNSGSNPASPSKATLRSLVTGAGTCSCQ